MKPSDVKALFARMEDDGEEVIKLDGLDDAIVGSAVTSTPARAGGAFTVTVLVYSLKGILKKLKKGNISDEEAMEFYSYNIERVLPYTLKDGVGAPVILHDLDEG